MTPQWMNPRRIRERIVVTGTLVLETPTHLGNGDTDGLLDMPLLLDPLEGRALLTGASIAGALRNYVREHSSELADTLFGRVEDDESVESPLIVDDALGDEPDLELRDGVAVDPKTRTAEARKKYDIELLAPETSFPLRFELLVLQSSGEAAIEAFALALTGLERGEISIGKRKRRGFGRCRVTRWTVVRYDVTTPQGVIAWLDDDQSGMQTGEKIAPLLGIGEVSQKRWPVCMVDALFALESSLLIRSGSGGASSPDMVHLHSGPRGKERAVLSGTSLGGALRARATRIANALGKDGNAVADSLFGAKVEGSGATKQLTASRIWVEESIIENPLELVQSRVKLDRFTGGSYPGALFSEQPVFGQDNTRLRLRFSIPRPRESEAGLLLLLLKDLWTGDLPLGGESSVGRGRLRGIQATFIYGDQSWALSQRDDGTLELDGDRDRLEAFVQAFVNEDDWK